MSNISEFIQDENGSVFKAEKHKAKKNTILKNNNVIVGAPKKIESKENAHTCSVGGNISPILEDGNIIGFVFECGCGEVAEIIFDYKETRKLPAS